MSMSTHVVGFKPPDEKWKKMKAIHDACKAAGVSRPDEVIDFFDGGEPEDCGVEASQGDLLRCGALVPFKSDDHEGFTLHVDKLPADVKIVRFVNSW